ncbi:MAG: class I SAM-dependent methyltransferase [Planctomycetota bacterium]|nr:MAG: class I SAM-dependent methyltransferase [Planctomycetota bacterium]
MKRGFSSGPLPVPCPLCAEPTQPRGETVHGPDPRVAGVPIELGSHAAAMRACPSCGLLFKRPFVPDETLLACYAASPGDNWEHDPDPIKRRFDQIAALIEKHAPGRRVLDIGCSNGALLKHLGSNWERSGLEPSAEAARVATERGISMLGATLGDLPADVRFDAILAIDVLEHLTDPDAFFRGVCTHLAPGGVFVALTGDHDAWGWRLQGNAYWYAALPEHQVFYCRRTIEHLARRNAMQLIAYRRTSHARHKPTRVVRDALRGLIHGLMRRMGLARRTPAPGWLPARDHMLFVLRGPGSA